MLQHRILARKIIGAAQKRLNLRGQHIQIERLGNEIIAAHIDRHDDIHIIRRRRHEDYRNLRHLPDPAAPVVPVVKGKLDVHQHQLGRRPRELLHNIGKILHADHIIIPAFQMLF